MDATILMIHCYNQNRVFGARTERMRDGDWWRTWAFPISERIAHAEGYDKTPVRGNLYCTEEYPGCPYCGSKGFVHCNKCHKLTCWNGETKMVCPWCNNNMDNIVTATEEFDLTGGSM